MKDLQEARQRYEEAADKARSQQEQSVALICRAALCIGIVPKVQQWMAAGWVTISVGDILFAIDYKGKVTESGMQ